VSADVEPLANREQPDATAPRFPRTDLPIAVCDFRLTRQRLPPRCPSTVRITSCVFQRIWTLEATLATTLPLRPPRMHSTIRSTEASQAILAMVERTSSFQRWIVHRPQRTRLRSSPAAASSAEPSPLDPFPQCILGSWERSQHRFLGFPQAQGRVVARSRFSNPHRPLSTSRTATAPRPNGRCSGHAGRSRDRNDSTGVRIRL